MDFHLRYNLVAFPVSPGMLFDYKIQKLPRVKLATALSQNYLLKPYIFIFSPI